MFQTIRGENLLLVAKNKRPTHYAIALAKKLWSKEVLMNGKVPPVSAKSTKTSFPQEEVEIIQSKQIIFLFSIYKKVYERVLILYLQTLLLLYIIIIILF